MSTNHTDLRKLHIIQLDDHKLFLAGMRTAILSLYPNAIIEDFSTTEKALNRIKELLHFSKQPDLIITDFNHPGGNGLEFAHEVKSLAGKLGVKVPVVMVAMVERCTAIPQGLENSPLDGFFNKNVTADNILDFISSLLPRNLMIK